MTESVLPMVACSDADDPHLLAIADGERAAHTFAAA
jgi:hypothetical protein